MLAARGSCRAFAEQSCLNPALDAQPDAQREASLWYLFIRLRLDGQVYWNKPLIVDLPPVHVGSQWSNAEKT